MPSFIDADCQAIYLGTLAGRILFELSAALNVMMVPRIS